VRDYCFSSFSFSFSLFFILESEHTAPMQDPATKRREERKVLCDCKPECMRLVTPRTCRSHRKQGRTIIRSDFPLPFL